MAKLVIFTDLDGTLLDREGAVLASVGAALDQLQAADIPVIPVSAKTQVEVQYVMAHLHLDGPFITENGSAVFIPEGYFPFAFPHDRRDHTHLILELGLPYHDLRAFLASLPPIDNLDIRGFGDMTLDEVAAATGLDPWAAARAKRREYDETLILDGPPGSVARFKELAHAQGLRVTHGGAFHHLLGPTDKGRAVQAYMALHARSGEKTFTAAIGNADNDLPLLAAVDLPVWVSPAGDGGAPPCDPNGKRYLAAPTWDRAVDQILWRAGMHSA